LARREYGKKGYCRVKNLEAWNRKHCNATWNVFIGYKTGLNETTGKNILIYT
jgi:hypothetical protein